MNTPYRGKFRVSQVYSASHDGLDLVGVDSKNIYSTVTGTVERAGWENANDHSQGFGRYVRIKEAGSTDRYYFGHMSEVKVKVGDTVSAGTLLGVEGSTGYSTGSHCHYGCRTDADKAQAKNISKISGIPMRWAPTRQMQAQATPSQRSTPFTGSKRRKTIGCRRSKTSAIMPGGRTAQSPTWRSKLPAEVSSIGCISTVAIGCRM